MRLLLDTQLAIWWQISAKSLSPRAIDRVQAAEAVFFSRVSLWEMGIKIGLGKLNIDLPLFMRQMDAGGFQWLELKNEHIVRLLQLPAHDDHKDPFDRLLIAQSLSEPMIFLTADKKLERYGAQVEIA